MLEIGPNLLLGLLFVCVAFVIMGVSSQVEEIMRSNRYRDENLAEAEIKRQKEITEQVRIAHAHVSRDCSSIKAT